VSLFPVGSATFGPQLSESGRPVYRYLLTRDLRGDGPPFVVVMVNPSTADADTNDATISRLIGFGRRAGARSLVVANLFAYRATDVRTLRTVRDPVGPENDATLRELARGNGRIVVAWGPLAKMPAEFRHRPAVVAADLRRAGASLFALAVCKDGQPSHPLMLPNAATPQPWTTP
jgi:hypothetical protein